MKVKEVHALSEEELKMKLEELKKGLMKESTQMKIKTTSTNPKKIKQIKKLRAKLLTEERRRKSVKKSK